MIACPTGIDEIHAGVGEIAALHSTPYILLLMSLVIGIVGNKLVRPSLAFIAFCAGAAASLHVTYTYTFIHNWNCEAIVVGSVVLGVIASLMAMAIMKAASFALGSVAGGSLTILMFDACGPRCNDAQWSDAPQMFGRQLIPFWLCFAVISTVTGYVCRRKEDVVLSLVTSLIGGWGVCTAIRMMVGVYHGHAPSWAYMLIGFGVAGLCFGAQTMIAKRQKRSKERKKFLRGNATYPKLISSTRRGITFFAAGMIETC